MKPYSVIKTNYVNSLLLLHKKLTGADFIWAIGGDLSEALRAIDVEPASIEIITSKEGAEQIFKEMKEYNPSKIVFSEQKLSREAVVANQTYPVSVRSYNFEFHIDDVNVKVYGDLQYRINNWDWGDKLEFTPETVSVVGETIPVVPLSLLYDLHQRLGWTDRAENVENVIMRGRRRNK